MPLIMIFYYVLSIFLIGLLFWNFIREKKIEDVILYLLVLIPLILRVLRVK
jgi:hypothetical protein